MPQVCRYILSGFVLFNLFFVFVFFLSVSLARSFKKHYK